MAQEFESDFKAFQADPFGFASAALLQWRLNLTKAGFPADLATPSSDFELKTPHLWLCQSQALTEAAIALIKSTPTFSVLPADMRPIADRQFRGAALMLVGYSLEVGLKAMLLISLGAERYIAEEQAFRKHRLRELAQFVPHLDERDNAILDGLTEFIYWAGRYPDPGRGKASAVDRIFELAERHMITLRDVLNLAHKVLAHTAVVVDKVYPPEQ